MCPRGQFVTLPILKPAAQPEPFPPGSRVYLRNRPGPHGIVRGMKRKRVIVHWPDLDCVGNHFPPALALAAEPNENTGPDETDEQEREDKPDAGAAVPKAPGAAPENPYERMLRRIRSENDKDNTAKP